MDAMIESLPPELSPGDPLTSSKIRELVNALRDRAEEGYRAGPGVHITDRTISAYGGDGGNSLELWTAYIVSSAPDGANVRRIYQIAELEKTGVGYGGWTALAGGRSGTAYSEVEDQNGVAGLMGNGVDTGNLTGTYALQAIPNGTRVTIKTIVLADGTMEYWIVGMPNGVDGACP